MVKGIAVGREKGFITEKRVRDLTKPAYRKGSLQKRVKFVREVVREVAGFAPYERRMLELLKVGKEKRALKFAKRRLGSHRRGKNKREEMSKVLRDQRQAGTATTTAKKGAKKGGKK
mmetsp:Transcript_103104/g.154546  ORF Transcript_103104/g.154546 Transcript_103104/m.154546 type:complete len:117 (-) Transcript_103104:65-415(-)